MDLTQAKKMLTELRRLNDRNPSFSKEVAVEIERRLLQLERIFAKATECVTRYTKSKKAAREKYKIALEAIDYAESYYLFAFRLRDLMRTLQGGKRLDALGVRNVRNHLIIHPEKPSSGILFSSFAVGGGRGPVLKAVRPSGQAGIHRDAGLYPNAQEFQTFVESVLRRAIAQTPRGFAAKEITRALGVRRKMSAFEAYCNFEGCSWSNKALTERKAMNVLRKHVATDHPNATG